MRFVKTILVGLFTATMFVVPITTAQAVGDCVVTDFSNSGANTLRECLTSGAVGGETITFDHGGSQETIELESTISRTGTVTIDGEGFVTVTLKAGSSGFSMIESSSFIEVRGMKFSGGEAPEGTAIKSSSGAIIQVRNSEFTDNEATTTVDASGGGAISGDGAVFIYGSTFTSNVSGREGGAIYAKGSVTVGQDSKFNSNVASDDGGAIYSNQGSMTVDDSSFTANEATGNIDDPRGGALYTSGSGSSSIGITVTNSHFEDNLADHDGGAIYSSYESSGSPQTDGFLKITNTTFVNNVATTDDGGAVFAEGDISINESTFTTNRAGIDGGAVFGEVDITIENSSVFTSNVAKDDGGAAYASSAITVTNSTFTTNKATEGAGVSQTSRGGALYSSNSSITVTGSTFTENESDNGGGAIYADLVVTINSSTFSRNEAGTRGGAIKSNNSDVNVTDNSTFTGNKALNGSGGAIWADDDIDIDDSTFTSNTSTLDGGAVYSLSLHDVFVDNSTFESNSADRNGGAIRSDEVVNVTDSIFTSNTAGQNGGAIYSEDGDETVTSTRSTFTSNSADNNGGAISGDDDVDIEDSTFTTNTAAYGGAVYAEDDVEAIGSLFSNNSASENGGAVWVHSDFNPTRSSFVSNRAANHGGAAYVEDNDTDIEYSYFAYNKADYDSDGNSDGSGDGGAVWVDEHLHVTNSTFYQNSGENGGAVYADNDSDDGFIVYSTFLDNTSESDGPSVIWRNGELDLMGNIFVGSQDKSQVVVESAATSVDHGANVTSFETSTVFDNSASQTGVSLSSFGVSTPATATLSLRPTVPFSFRSPSEFAVTDDVITSFNTASVGQSDTDAPSDDQAGTTRTAPFTTGAEFLSIFTAPVPYSGPIITDVGGNGISAPFSTFEGETVRVVGERLLTVSKVFVDDKEGEVISTADDHFIMTVPEGVSPGTHDLVIQSSIGNLTYLDGFVVSSAGVDNAAANAVCEGAETSWWTQRISDSQAKAYIKCPAEGQKYRILQQIGGSGDYNSVFVKTLADENDSTQVFNEFGRYIVRTIDLEDINRLRITVDDEELWKVRYNRE